MFYVGETINPHSSPNPTEVLEVTANYILLRDTVTNWEYHDYVGPLNYSKYLLIPSTHNSVPTCADVPGHPTWTEYYPPHLEHTYRHVQSQFTQYWYKGKHKVTATTVWSDFYGV